MMNRLAAILLMLAAPALATNHYVSLSGGNVAPYLSWADAATSLTGVVAATASGATIYITQGVYNVGYTPLVNVNRGGAGNNNMRIIGVDGAGATQFINTGAFAGSFGLVFETGGGATNTYVEGITVDGFEMNVRIVGPAGTDSVFKDCVLKRGGSAPYTTAKCTFRDCIIESNQNYATFGGMFFSGTADDSLVEKCIVRGAKTGQAAITTASGCPMTFRGVSVERHENTTSGGTILSISSTATVELSRVSSCIATAGTASSIFNAVAGTTIRGCSITDNRSSGYTVLDAAASPSWQSCLVAGNFLTVSNALRAGWTRANATARMYDSVIIGNEMSIAGNYLNVDGALTNGSFVSLYRCAIGRMQAANSPATIGINETANVYDGDSVMMPLAKRRDYTPDGRYLVPIASNTVQLADGTAYFSGASARRLPIGIQEPLVIIKPTARR